MMRAPLATLLCIHWLSFVAARITIYKTDTDFWVRGTARNATVSDAGTGLPAQIATQPTVDDAKKQYYYPIAADAAATAVSALQAAFPAAADCAVPAAPEGTVGTVLLVHAAGPDVCGFKSDADVATVSGGQVDNLLGLAGTPCASCGLLRAPNCTACAARQGRHLTYTVPKLKPSNRYLAKFTFSETHWLQIGKRLFDVRINGNAVVAGLDVYSLSQGRFVPVMITAEVNQTTDTMIIDLEATRYLATLSAVEVYDMGAVTCTPPPAPQGALKALLLVNSGGPELCGFQADEDTASVASGGVAVSYSAAPQCAACALNPTVACVACTSRQGDTAGYSTPRLTKGNMYIIRLTFTKTSPTPAKGRSINVLVNGQPIHTGVEPYSDSSQYELYSPITVNAEWQATSNNMKLTLVGLNGQVALAAVEVYEMGMGPCSGPPAPPAGAVSTVRLINARGPAICGYTADTNQHPAGTEGKAQSYDREPGMACTTCGNGTSHSQACTTCTVRYGQEFSYKLPNLKPDNGYLVRLTFIEPQFAAAGRRLFDVRINGMTVLRNLDVYKESGNQRFVPLTKELRVTQMSHIMTVALGGTTGDAILAAAEVYDMGPAGCTGPPPPPPGTVKALQLVNAGGPGICGHSPDTDAAPTGLGGTYGIPGTCDTCTANPSQACLACTVRWGKVFSYRVDQLTPCNIYTVRLTFADAWWTEGENRVQDVYINDEKVFDGINSLALSGGRYIPITREVRVTQPTGTMNITLRSDQEYAVLAAYEVYDMGPGECPAPPTPDPIPPPGPAGADAGIPVSFRGDTMGRLTRDVRGVFLDLAKQPLLVTSRDSEDPRRAPTGFTYASRLSCSWTGCKEAVGRCDMSASLLPADLSNVFVRQAIMFARCELTPIAQACDPLFKNGQVISGQGQVEVILAPDSTTLRSSNPRNLDVINIRSFAGDILVDNIYPLGRPSTILSGLIGFRRGSMRFNVRTGDNPITRSSLYDGRLTLSLYKGPF